MESRNPVFTRTDGFQREGYATFDASPRGGAPTPPTPQDLPAGALQDMYSAPSATPVQTGRMTLDDVIVRTAAVGAVLVTSAAATFIMLPVESLGVLIIAALIGFGLGLVNSFRREPSPPLIFLYAAVQGVFVGGISKFYETMWDGIVVQAVLATLAAFATMLGLYCVGAIRATPKFQRILIIATVGYLVFGLVHMIGVWTNLWPSVYSSGILGVAISAFGVVLASLFLVLDFDFIEQGIRNGVPQKCAWTAAFGLIVTLIWLYLEILRLIAILRGSD